LLNYVLQLKLSNLIREASDSLETWTGTGDEVSDEVEQTEKADEGNVMIANAIHKFICFMSRKYEHLT
jgi:hypothetical protein